MKFIKKSFNTTGDLAQRMDDYIRDNPGVSFTMLVNQALIQWLKNPVVELTGRGQLTERELQKILEDNRELLKDLAK